MYKLKGFILSVTIVILLDLLRWRRGVVVNALVVINEVTLRRARLVWVIYRPVNHLGM